MSTDRETTRIVRSWLEEGVTSLPDRVLDSVLDQVPATPQRRSWWPSWRSNSVNTYAKLFAAAAAVLVVAVVGYQFLPGKGGNVGTPTIAPSPSPAPLARGTFRAKGAQVVLEAAGNGDHVTGTMTVDEGFTVDLKCARNADDGRLLIAGDTTVTTSDYAVQGTWTAIVIKPGSPAHAVFNFDGAPALSCLEFLDGFIDFSFAKDIGDDALEPIQGTVELYQ